MLQLQQVLHDRYQLKQKLGHNSGRQTWMAEDLTTQEAVVIKLLTFGGDVQWDDLKLFEREAQVLQQLNHPRIPQYRDYFAIDDRSLWFGLVHDYIPGTSLKDLLAQGKTFDESQVHKIAVEVLQILIYLHQLSPAVLHRDIKPSNLIWGKDEQIYLVDFGAVQAHGIKRGATFTVVGTYGYAPVEQFGGRTAPASDLYALGATLIHLLTGTSPADLPQRHLYIQFDDRVSLSPSLVSWIRKMTEPTVELRLSQAKVALEALESGQVLEVAIAPQPQDARPLNTSGQGLFDRSTIVPQEIKGWNWGAFLLAPYWSLTNKVWLGLFSWVLGSTWWVFRIVMFADPLIFKGVMTVLLVLEVGLMVALGMKGNEWAWKSSYWRSVSHFNTHQRRWATFGIALGIPLFWWAWIEKFKLIFFWLAFHSSFGLT